MKMEHLTTHVPCLSQTSAERSVMAEISVTLSQDHVEPFTTDNIHYNNLILSFI